MTAKAILEQVADLLEDLGTIDVSQLEEDEYEDLDSENEVMEQ